jgi:flagellar biosynthesis protein FlhA
MAMDPMGGQVQLPGQHTLEPTFGLPATWIDEVLRGRGVAARLHGRRCRDRDLDPPDGGHQGHTAELLSHVEVQKLLRDLPKEHGDLVRELVPTLISTTGIQRVLQLLLADASPSATSAPSLEGIADVVGSVKSPRDIAEHVPHGLAQADLRPIYRRRTGTCRSSPLLAALGDGPSLIPSSDRERSAISRCSPTKRGDSSPPCGNRFEDAARMGEMPVLVTSSGVRPYVRSIIERFRRETPVLGQAKSIPGRGSRRSGASSPAA